jgi:hypothetical protein
MDTETHVMKHSIKLYGNRWSLLTLLNVEHGRHRKGLSSAEAVPVPRIGVSVRGGGMVTNRAEHTLIYD